MKDFPLSIICVFHNQKEDAEATLTTLYEEMTIPFEMVIIDNGSDDGTNAAIQSVLRHFNHESTYFFEVPEHRSHALCINDALTNAACPVIWVPGVLSGFNASALTAAVGDLLRSQAPFAVCGGEVPIRPDRWIQAISDHTLPPDASFLVRLDTIHPQQRFLNPFLTRAFFPEWIIRTDSAGLVLACKDALTLSPNPYLTDADRNEMFLSLVRSGRWKLSDITDVYKSVKSSAAVRLGNDVSTIERLIRDGEIQPALEAVDKLLAAEPGRVDAISLKIKILEKLQKYVEAAELKRKIQEASGNDTTIKKAPIMIIDPFDDPGDVPDDVIHEDRADAIRPDKLIRISIIIPTSTDRKSMLEECLTALHAHADGANRELIVINNAAMDDTAHYLNELEAKGFMNLKVITNDANLGFGTAVNQGIRLAAGETIVVMHNDVTITDDAPGRLADLLLTNEDVVLAGPVTDHTTNGSQQADGAAKGDLIDCSYLDSFCLVFRKQDELAFDESFGLAWFDDIDFCITAVGESKRIVADPSIWVHHRMGTTTDDLGILNTSAAYWKNSDHFHRKWDFKFIPEIDSTETEPVGKVIAIGALVNPYFPEEPYLSELRNLFTSEVKHEIATGEWNRDQSHALIRALMAVDQRDLLRTLEEKMDLGDLDFTMVELLIQYYYDLLIFSRCKSYIEKVDEQDRTLSMYLTLLKISISNKELESAAEMATVLTGFCPAHPELLMLSAQIHDHYRHPEEAETFRTLARQLNPSI